MLRSRSEMINLLVKRVLVISFSFCIAFMLQLMPLPHFLLWYRPMWLPLLIIFWCLALPEYVGVGVAWSLGLFVDALQGSVLGMHALGFVVIAYCVVKFHLRIWLFSITQQMTMVFLLCFVVNALQFWVLGMIGQEPHTLKFWIAPLASTVLWPFVFVLLQGYCQRFNLN